ncbi:hypothetical protein [Kribbella sancticallisti]|uniref:aspartate racemase/maleate isomerase family protein n=1 Tax=Kribbella sancticallisti TaxID=460087 RepID=UPI003CD05748
MRRSTPRQLSTGTAQGTKSVSPIAATGPNAEALLSMSATTVGAVDELVASGADLFLYGCLSTSLARGTSWNHEFSAGVEARTGRPCAASDATVRAVRWVGARRIGLVTPYPEAIDRLLLASLADRGIEIASHASLRISDSDEVGRRKPSEVSELARSVEGDFDPVVLAADLRTGEVIEELERDFGVPAVTTSQALARLALDALAGGASVCGYGSLLSRTNLADVLWGCRRDLSTGASTSRSGIREIMRLASPRLASPRRCRPSFTLRSATRVSRDRRTSSWLR